MLNTPCLYGTDRVLLLFGYFIKKFSQLRLYHTAGTSAVKTIGNTPENGTHSP